MPDINAIAEILGKAAAARICAEDVATIKQLQEADSRPPRKICGKWIPQVLGDPDGDNWEISVVREDNTHGRKSWGWFGKNKFLVSHNGGPCSWSLAPGLGGVMVKIAQDYAESLNSKETIDA